MIINRNAIVSAMGVAFNEAFMSAMAGYPDAGLYREIAFCTSSTAKTEEFGFLANIPQLREWIGDRHIGNIARYAMQVTNKKFEATVHLLGEELEDDAWARKIPMASVLGEEVERARNEATFGLLGSGFTALAYDGQSFFNANHPVTNAAGATVLLSNLQPGLGAPWYLMDLSSSVMRPLIHTDRRAFTLRQMTDAQDEQVFMREEYRYGTDGRFGVGLALWQKAFASRQVLSQANFDAAVTTMGQLIRDGGGPAAVKPTHLVCGYSNQAAAKQLLEAQLTAVAIGTGGAAVSNTNFGAVKLLVTPYLP